MSSETGLTYKDELDRFCTENGLEWKDLSNLAAHCPQHPEATAVLLHREDLPRKLNLTKDDLAHRQNVLDLARVYLVP